MTLRIKHKVWVNTSRNTAMTDLVYGPTEVERLVQTDAFDQWGGGSFSVGASLNEDLDLGDITNVKGIYFQCDSDVRIKINGSSDLIQLRKPSNGSNAKFFIEADITQINVDNDSATDPVSGHFHIWGSST
jgi:hypothetical protein